MGNLEQQFLNRDNVDDDWLKNDSPRVHAELRSIWKSLDSLIYSKPVVTSGYVQAPTEPSPVKSPHSDGVFPKPDKRDEALSEAIVSISAADLDRALAALQFVRDQVPLSVPDKRLSGLDNAIKRLEKAMGLKS